MLDTSATFQARATKRVRRISGRVLMSFDKSFDPGVTFFTLNSSLLDGPDVLASSSGDVVQEWDKYAYMDYSDRLISMEWTRQDDLPSSVSLAMADIVLDNHDNFFTPGSGSAVDGDVLPRRPVRLMAGFGGDSIPVFVGLTEKMPTLDQAAGTASFHCIDFLDSLFNRPLDETVLLLDVYTDEVLDALFQDVGLLASQYVLAHGFNKIPIVYFPKGTKLGDAVRDLMDAEAGRLYMDEVGIIRFQNRASFSDDPVYAFDASTTIAKTNSSQSDIINVVEVKAKPRAVQDKQPVWQLAEAKLIPDGSSIDIWADLTDPTTTVDTPVLGETSNTSYIVVRQGADTDDTEVTSGITISAPTLFGLSYKVTVANSTGAAVYVTKAEFWGTPAKVIDDIYLRVQDDASVALYDEQPYTIESDFIQSEDAARSLALSILYQYAAYGATVNIDVKGTPALQLADAVSLDIGATNGTFVTTKIAAAVRDSRFLQSLRATQITPLDFFVLDESILDGPTVLSP